jgi:16S rRNA (uracil1498-N3)-methyltransferase
MRIHRFYIEKIEISSKNIFVTQETLFIHQLKNVFRYKLGQKIHVFNEITGEIEVEIFEIGKKDMSFKYIRHINNIINNKESNKNVCLYMSIIKNSNFELIVEKAVELGVFEIIPVITERTIKNNLNIQRINKIIKEATEQSGRVDLMKIRDVVNLKNAIKIAKDNSTMVYFGSLDENDSIINIDKKHNQVEIALFIGPEGGFSDEELSIFKDKYIKPLRLGRYVLRAETAAIVACGTLSL